LRLTQEKLADIAGIGRVTLVRIEKGGQSPKYDTLVAGVESGPGGAIPAGVIRDSQASRAMRAACVVFLPRRVPVLSP
jgi:hypothetical protein